VAFPHYRQHIFDQHSRATVDDVVRKDISEVCMQCMTLHAMINSHAAIIDSAQLQA
jgi:hypothetical protein